MEIERITDHSGRKGLQIRGIDYGPGMGSVELALMVGYSTSGGLGMGLPCIKSMMDELQIETAPGKGTTLTMRKWLNNDRANE